MSKCTCGKKGNGEMCPGQFQKVFHPMLATTSSKHEDDDRDGKQRTSSNDAKKIRETPDPVVARCQMPTSENMYSYPASSFAR